MTQTRCPPCSVQRDLTEMRKDGKNTKNIQEGVRTMRRRGRVTDVVKDKDVRANAVFLECIFGFVSSCSKEKAIHPSLLKMDGGSLTIAEYALTSSIGTQSITLLNMTSGFASISKLSTADSGPIVSENAALLIVSEGSLNITDQVFSNLTRIRLSPSVLEYKAKTIQLYMNNVTMKDCQSQDSPHLISIQSESSFKEGHVIMKNTKAPTSPIPSPRRLRWDCSKLRFADPATDFEILGRDESVNWTYACGRESGADNKFCGQLNTPCSSFDDVFGREVEGHAWIMLMSDSKATNERVTQYKTMILETKLGDVLSKLTFLPSARLTVKSGMLFETRRLSVDFAESATNSGFVVQGSLQLKVVHFNMLGRTHSGAVNVVGGFVWMRNATTTPNSKISHNQLLNVSRGQVFLMDAALGGLDEKKMKTEGAILVFVQSGILQIETTVFQYIAKESEGDGGWWCRWGDSSTGSRCVQRLHSADACSLCAGLSQLVLRGHCSDDKCVVHGRDDEETEPVGCAVREGHPSDSGCQTVQFDATIDARHSSSRQDGAGGAGEHEQCNIPSRLVCDRIERGSGRRE
ncbi:hypothetical protein BLNAU_23077 [Blattamonas nauphoetae]|uniref:Uncharacterized protein n=1 Tax=Blattamonas nauphoetae TaxID=2049346 RepID=A0ABQ9WTG1_9EUKA|nr:hypothetical protein BLNAU_23077 [Blattamonas nauphoetae]